MVRKKPKKCKLCGLKINFKLRHAIYCEKCGVDIRDIRLIINASAYRCKVKFPNYDIKVIIKIKPKVIV